MPALEPSRIVQFIIDAFDKSDASAVLISQARGHPRRFIVQSGRNSFKLWVYAWTLTHGGGAARPKNEYRIQLTGVQAPLPINPDGLTVLIGIEPNTGCFAGFDLQKHFMFSTKSPSIQIPITTLHEALQNGFSFVTKGNDEIAIGIRPDQFLAYCINAKVLHRDGADATMINLLTRAASLEIIASEDMDIVTPDRKRIVAEVSRLSRDSNFRNKVTAAYDKRCAVTRMQLRLIDAAHILPVGADGSSDGVENGICLSPTYHRAFDRALIYLDESLRMQINRAKVGELTAEGLDGGLAEFGTYLNRRIHLPQDRTQWPNPHFIREANRIRRIPF